MTTFQDCLTRNTDAELVAIRRGFEAIVRERNGLPVTEWAFDRAQDVIAEQSRRITP